MDHSESDRVIANELRTTLNELRDKNKKLTEEKKAANASLGWVVAVLLLAVIGMMTCGANEHVHRSLY